MPAGIQIEVLTFVGCPHGEPAIALVERVVGQLGVTAEVRRIDVPDPRTALRERFLGSPTIRVAGRDIEPGAEQRTDYSLSCRLYRTSQGMSGQPDVVWLRNAITREQSARR
jgi:hypothetical protein